MNKTLVTKQALVSLLYRAARRPLSHSQSTHVICSKLVYLRLIQNTRMVHMIHDN